MKNSWIEKLMYLQVRLVAISPRHWVLIELSRSVSVLVDALNLLCSLGAARALLGVAKQLLTVWIVELPVGRTIFVGCLGGPETLQTRIVAGVDGVPACCWHLVRLLSIRHLAGALASDRLRIGTVEGISLQHWILFLVLHVYLLSYNIWINIRTMMVNW